MSHTIIRTLDSVTPTLLKTPVAIAILVPAVALFTARALVTGGSEWRTVAASDAYAWALRAAYGETLAK